MFVSMSLINEDAIYLQTLPPQGSELRASISQDTIKRAALLPQESQLDDVSIVRDSIDSGALLQKPHPDDASTLPELPQHEKPRQRKRFTFYRHTRPMARRRPVAEPLKENEKVSNRAPGMKLRYHRLKMWLILLYSIVTVFSWTIHCILCYRPIQMPTYRNQGTYTKRQYEDNNRWTTIARVTNAIVSAISIPVTSAICAKAAVAYCQTPPDSDKEKLSMRQTLALADKGWSDIHTLSSLLQPSLGRRIGSRLLVFSALLCGVGIAIPTLQGALIDVVHAKTMAREDLRPPFVGAIGSEAILAPPGTVAASPGANAHLESAMIQYITDTTFTSSFDEVTTNIWSRGGDRQTKIEPLLSPNSTNWFLTLLPVGTDTGILPQLALRINSSLECDNIPQDSFPSTRLGSNSFSASFSNAANLSKIEDYTTETFSFRVYATSGPDSFSQGARDRQDISEYLYLDLSQANASLTYQCRLDTSAGYFELPNYWNNHTAGELLTKWPEDKVYQDKFFQQTFNKQNVEQLTDTHTNPSENEFVPTGPQRRVRRDSAASQGPLVISALAIFGSGTFFDGIASANDSGAAGAKTCGQLQQPFMGVFPSSLTSDPSGLSPNDPGLSCEPYRNGLLAQHLLDWLNLLLSPENLHKALRATTTSASKTLTQPDWHDGGRVIYTSAGTDILKLHMPLGALVTISALIALQLVGLLSLAIYASSRPTWTESLDAFAMLRFGAAMASKLPSISSLEAKHMAVLDETDGWVGHQKSKVGLKALTIGGSMRPRNDVLYRLVDPGKKVRFYLHANGEMTTRVYRG